MTYLKVRALVKKFKNVVAVDNISFDAGEGEIVVLLGPSGCGKTTILRCIAGLEVPDSGEIRVGETIFYSSSTGVFVEPEDRNVGMVFQSYAVWPHMTVYENVAYGLKAKKLEKNVIDERTKAVLNLVGLGELMHRKASELSGGQQQRVALARALAYNPKMLLFDEPLSNLDARLREIMRIELRNIIKKAGITTVYVTHDQIEALYMADKLIVMNKGKCEQIGSPLDVCLHPKNFFVANFFGMINNIEAIVTKIAKNVVELKILGTDSRAQVIGSYSLHEGDKVLICFRPEHVEMYKSPISDDLIEADVINCVFLGNHIEYLLNIGNSTIRATNYRWNNEEIQNPYKKIYLKIEPDHAILMPSTEKTKAYC